MQAPENPCVDSSILSLGINNFKVVWFTCDTKSIIMFTMAMTRLSMVSGHSNGIEHFWSYSKHRLMNFHGIPKSTFYFHLKECDFRFN